jgi:hypothetical protein
MGKRVTKTCRTPVKSPHSEEIRPMAPDKFVYFDIVNGIIRRLHSLDLFKIPLMTEAFVNVNGLPIFL